MKKLLFTLLFFSQSIQAGLFEALGLKKEGQKLEVVIDDPVHEVTRVKNKLKEMEAGEKGFLDDVQHKTDEIKTAIISNEEHLKAEQGAEQQEHIHQKLLLLKGMKQVLANTKNTYKEIINIFRQYTNLLDEHQKNIKIPQKQEDAKSLYTFEELQKLTQKIVDQEEKVAHVRSERNEAVLDVESRKQKIETAEKVYREKEKEQREFGAQKPSEGNQETPLRFKGEILDLEVKLAKYELGAARLKDDEGKARLDFFQSTVSLEEKQLQIIQKKRDRIVRLSLRVDENDLEESQVALDEAKRRYLTTSDGYLHKIEKLSLQEDQLRKKQTEFQKKHSEVEHIYNTEQWIELPKTVEACLAIFEAGLQNDELILLGGTSDLLRAQIDLEKAEFRVKEITSYIVRSWFSIKHQQFKGGEVLTKEIKKYKDLLAELEREKSVFEDKQRVVTTHVGVRNKALNNLQKLRKETREQKNYIFKHAESKFNQCMSYLEKAQPIILKQIEITSKQITTYAKIVGVVVGSIKQVDAMLKELQRVTLWHRSHRALSKESLNNVIPDLLMFIDDLKTLTISYMAHLSPRLFFRHIVVLFHHPASIFLFLLRLVFAFIFFALARLFIPRLTTRLMLVDAEYRIVYGLSRFAVVCLSFVYKHLVSIFVWLLLLVFVGLQLVFDTYPSVLFFLFSIIYLLYLARSFVLFLVQFNDRNDHVLFAQSFKGRLTLVCRAFLYTSIVILCFREAFMLATYTKSELPNVLLALYSIIFRVLMISLIKRDELLHAITTKTWIGSIVWRLVDRYFYFMQVGLIGLMVIGDPHIGGYNNLALFLFWAVAGSIIIVRVLFLLYAFCRRTSSNIFFSSDGETLKERFYGSKSWYGLSVGFLFISFVIIGIIVLSWLWGRPISFQVIGDWFYEPRLSICLKDGGFQKVSILDLSRTLLLIPAGFFVSFIIDKFVLHRIFSVLLVDPGIHNAVSTVTYYIVFLTVVTVGLWNEGFDFLIGYYIMPLLLGMVWALRDLFNDFVAYFVILIQRPFKVGDYILLDHETCGVVRKIAPRAVTLRRKNSFTLVVPNAHIVKNVITNWGSSTFLAFPDVFVRVAYSADPVKVRSLIMDAVVTNINILKTPQPIVRLDSLGDYGYEFMVRGFTTVANQLEQWNIASDVRFAVVAVFEKNSIKLAAPIRIVKTVDAEDRSIIGQ